jgi:2,5-furandicarboxylate decarboxylase 1
VARAEPNGYTIGTPTTPTPSSLIAGLVKKPQYDPARCPLEPLMQENFRQFLDRLRQAGELVDIHQPVDIRHISTLVDQAKTALFFHRVIGYDIPLVSGIIRSRERATMALGCDTYGEIEHKLKAAIDKPIPPKRVKTSPTREVTLVGDDVDLYKIPIPMSSIYDGGPMITAGVVIARDPELGMNSGIYRFIVKEKSLTGIDIVTPNNMRLFAQRAFERKEALPISISIGTHPIEITGSGYRAPLGVDEMAIAGGLRGEPVELAPCQTIDVPYVADAEIVLEAEILPTGWTWPEGRFGEFTRLMGGLHWNPLVRIKAISMRKDAIYYNLHMPWENTWLAAPTRYAAIRQALRTAGVQVKDINVTLGGCAFWHAVISIKKHPGEGKNALLAALSVMDLKHVVVVDDDIDVNDPGEVEWAIATRVQGDRDVMIVSNARAKPLDPSLPQGYGVVPTGAKVGIDATMPEGIPREYYERITYAYAESAKIEDYVNGKRDAAGEAGDADAVKALAAQILDAITTAPLYYTDIGEKFAQYDFNTIARAIGHLHATEKLWQDSRGRMCVRGSQFAATPPKR